MGYFDTYLASEQRHSMSYERWMEYNLEDLERQLAESQKRERKLKMWAINVMRCNPGIFVEADREQIEHLSPAPSQARAEEKAE